MSRDRQRFRYGLMCAALEEALRSVVVFDAPLERLRAAAGEWAEMLGAVAGCRVEVVWLGSTEGEDELWGRPALRRSAGGGDAPALRWHPGRLYPPPPPGGLRLVVIPDLARLSLPAARACVALVGAETAVLERHGHGDRWSPRLAWMAGVRRAEVGEVSPHLLDRFALRLSSPPGRPAGTATAIREWVLEGPMDPEARLATLRRRRLVRAAAVHARLPAAVLARIPPYFRPPREGVRHELALARLARAAARLDGASVVSGRHLRTAAAVVGLQRPHEPAAPALPAEAHPERPAPEVLPAPQPLELRGPPAEVAVVAEPAVPAAEGEHEAVLRGDEETELAAVSVGAAAAYPEDTAPTLRDPGSLRLPPSVGARDDARGPVIGTQRAVGMRDLAIVETLLEALKHRPLRRARGEPGVRICRSDLRAYRRAAAPEHLLVVALDFTALHGRAWEDALLDHLGWAYVERARVAVVRIGAAGARSPLRAEAVEGRNVLSGRVGFALSGAPGSATPLAHGLELALRALRPALQHGRARVREARLVVASDGRGNVPLTSSRADERPGAAVGDRGVRDALEVAREVRSLRGLDAVLLDPHPSAYPGLPGQLAHALGARVEPIAAGPT